MPPGKASTLPTDRLIMSVSELDMIPIVVLYVDNCLKIRQQYQDSSQHSGTLVSN